MVKIGLIVFSISLVLSIQFVVGQQEEEVKITPELIENLWIHICGVVTNKLADDGVVDPKVVSSRAFEEEVTKTFVTAKKEGSHLKITTNKEEEQFFEELLGYLFNQAGKAGLLDTDAVYKKLYKTGTKSLTPEFETLVAKASNGFAAGFNQKRNRPQHDGKQQG